MKKHVWAYLLLLLLLIGCQDEAMPATEVSDPEPIPAATTLPAEEAVAEAAATEPPPEPAGTEPPLATATPLPQPTETATVIPTVMPEAALAAAVIERMNAFMQAREDAGFRGVVTVIQGGDTLLNRGLGYADDEAAVANGAEVVYDIGSLAKQFTAAAILRLEMDGLLTTSDLLSQHLPDVPADKQTITLHQLLTHSSGLPEALGDDYEPVQRDDYIERAFAAELVHQPGAAYLYSNVGYSLLAAVIETITGDSYEVYLRESLFEPAGLQNTGYVLPDWTEASIAMGYSASEPQGRPNELPWADDGPYWHLRGNGGILSTAADMHRWQQALLDDRILSDGARAKLFAPHMSEGPNGDSAYGYGWVILPTPRDTLLITHNGGNGIFFADYWYYPAEDLFIYVATNEMIPGEHGRWAGNLAGIYFDPDFEPSAVVAAVELEPVVFPEGPAGELATAFLDALTNGDAESRRAFIEARYTPDLVEVVSMDDHLAIMDELGGLLANLQLGVLEIDGDTYLLEFYNANGHFQFLLILVFSDEEPPRIAQIGIED